MPTQSFALEPGGPKRVEISWSGLWKETTVKVDGQPLVVFPDKAALKEGKTLALPDGSSLGVRLVEQFANVALEVTRNGQPLPGSSQDPAEMVKQASYLLYFVAGLTALVSLAAAVGHVEVLEQLGFGWPGVVEAALYAVLAFFTSRRSRVALWAAIVLFALDGVFWLIGSVGDGRTPPVGGLVMRVVLLVQLVRAASALGSLKAAAKSA